MATNVGKISKFFKQEAIPSVIGGVAATAATHPIEQGQIGTSHLPKKVPLRDEYGNVVSMVKNPARYGTIDIPFTDEDYEFDKGDSSEHFLARVPKGIAGWGAALTAKNLITKAKYFK